MPTSKAKPPGARPRRVSKPKAATKPKAAAAEQYGTAEELDAFWDRLLERGEQLKREFAELNERLARKAG